MSLFEVEDARRAMLPQQARAFDFLQGAWKITHRRLRTRLANANDWVEFETPFVMTQILGGLGNIDQCQIASTDSFFEGVSLRLFDLAIGQWRIYWMDSDTGRLFPPVTGSFDADRGVFYGEETRNGVPLLVRFTWDKTNQDRPVWEQAFSTDAGHSWETNWYMTFNRPAPA